MSDQQFDAIERFVIWEAHRKICKYGKEPIAFDAFHIDHIVPEKATALELAEYRALYNLPLEYDVLAYYNHAPACYSCNNRKKNKASGFTQFFIATVLEDATALEPEITKLIQKMRTENQSKSIYARLQFGIDNGTLTRPEINNMFAFADNRLTNLLSNSASAYTPLIGPSGTGNGATISSTSASPTQMNANKMRKSKRKN